LKDEKLIKRQIDPYNFELYRFKLCAFFLRHTVYIFTLQRDRLVVFLQNIVTITLRSIFKR